MINVNTKLSQDLSGAADQYAPYWNDAAEESKKKGFQVDQPGGKAALERYLRRSGLLRQLQIALRSLPVRGVGADLAAGTCWASAILSKLPEVAEIQAVDYSENRILRLAAKTIAALDGIPSKIRPRVGSFYDTGIGSAELDFCLLSQAFHHADDPLRLLGEVMRILKPGGAILMIGENPVPVWWKGARLAKFCWGHRRLPRTFAELYPADARTGDHYYRRCDYHQVFKRAGIRLVNPVRGVFTGTNEPPGVR